MKVRDCQTVNTWGPGAPAQKPNSGLADAHLYKLDLYLRILQYSFNISSSCGGTILLDKTSSEVETPFH